MFCGVFCWFGGGMLLGLFDRISAVCGGRRESGMLLLKSRHGWWPAMEQTALLLGCISSRDKFWRLVHWIILHVCDKYTKIILFPKESGCELQELSCGVGVHWNWPCKACTSLCKNMLLNHVLMLGSSSAKQVWHDSDSLLPQFVIDATVVERTSLESYCFVFIF